MADPLSAALAATAFFSFAKDLFDVGKDLNALRNRMVKAPQILCDLINEVHLLEQYLSRLAQFQHLEHSDAFTKAVIANLERKIEMLRNPIEQLRQTRKKSTLRFRLATAINFTELRKHLKDVEGARSLAMTALQLSMHAAMQLRFDTIALRLADIEELSSQNAVLTQRVLLSLDQPVRTMPDALCLHCVTDRMLLSSVETLEEDDSIQTLCAFTPRKSPLARKKNGQEGSKARTVTIKPWFISQVWTLSWGAQSSYWQHSLRIRSLHASHSPVVQAIRIGDIEKARILIEAGHAHPQDYFVPRSGDTGHLGCPIQWETASPLLYLAIVQHDMAMLQLLLNLSKVENDIALLSNLLDQCAWFDLRENALFEQAAFRLLTEMFDLDLVLDWPDPLNCKPGTFTIPWHSKDIRWLLQRQKRLANDASLHDSRGILRHSVQDVSIRLTWRDNLAAYGISGDLQSFTALPQTVKDFLLVCFIDGTDKAANGRTLLQAGANPTAVIQGTTATEILLQQALVVQKAYSRVAGLTGVFHDWLELLKATSVGYDACLTDGHIRPCLPPLGEDSRHASGQAQRQWLIEYKYNAQVRKLDIKMQLEISFDVRCKYHPPGTFPAEEFIRTTDLDQSFALSAVPNMGEMNTLFSKHSLILEMDEDQLREHMGYSADSELNHTQDDHGLVARSFTRSHHQQKTDSSFHDRSRTSRKGRPRSVSQPRSLYGHTWLCLRQARPRWQDSVHRCPFDPHHYLHWLEGASRYDPRSPLDGDFSACLRNHPAFHQDFTQYQSEPMSLFDVWFEELRAFVSVTH